MSGVIEMRPADGTRLEVPRAGHPRRRSYCTGSAR